MKKIAIVQSNYIPWKGYFDLINMVDEFILYDDAQYTKRDWRNRNRIKTAGGLKWLTIPVETKGKYSQAIKDTRISDPQWGKKHWIALVQQYKPARFFNRYKEIFENLYLNSNERYLSLINYKFLRAVNQIIGIDTTIRFSSEFDMGEGKTEKLLNICKACNATTYVSGPAAKSYFNEALASKEKIALEWIDYQGYPEYSQLHPPFEHGVSVLDLLFNEGPDTTKFMKSF